ncbi:lytic transglycosylase domain-containing protein [Natranaerobius thermophilus]|uniref:Lytic transglycosylase catalytic n=1 Tax=Natranaerobius thermophilus (strain ATCC BAA-1301 / DSM 18059 / JW/NM-WN-LF) TaxID=457570 RepID=B2A8H8_NATTJ|nr:lytic transglycosylase domain-containing protein [Natranaerobius thermophilus]ACB85862.1 Lytic transglycosylase catalytic [Natranaerobius thermophilus JW/NM-WN-LF]
MLSTATLDMVYLVVIFGLILCLVYVVMHDEELSLVISSSLEESDLDGRLDLYRVRRMLNYQLSEEYELTIPGDTEFVEGQPEAGAVQLASANAGELASETEEDKNIRMFKGEDNWSWGREVTPEDITDITPMNKEVAEKLLTQSENLDLEISLLLGLIEVESRFDPKNVSHAGAVGIMQIMPGTAQALADKNDFGYEYEKLFDPFYNIKLGTIQLNYLLNQYDGDIHKALTAYNRGPGGLQSYIARTNSAQSGFSRWVLEEAERFEEELNR